MLCGWLFWNQSWGLELAVAGLHLDEFLSLPALHLFLYLLLSWCLHKHFPPSQSHICSGSVLHCCCTIFLIPCFFLNKALWVTVSLHFPSSSAETVGMCTVSLLASKSTKRRTQGTTGQLALLWCLGRQWSSWSWKPFPGTWTTTTKKIIRSSHHAFTKRKPCLTNLISF